jgi:S-DNA-T family DNA segregation ATPase FtsK/SpoIIIE
MGADKLLGNGDMLYLSPGTSTMMRGQGTFLSDDEISRVVDFVGVDDPQFAGELMQLKTKDELEAAAVAGGGNFQSRDDLYDAAVDIVIRERRGSCSLLQRALGIGYGRAARLIDFMAEDGVVGQYNGSQARDVLISLEDWEARRSGEAPPVKGDAAAANGLNLPKSAAAGATAKPRTVSTTSERATFNTIVPRRRNKIVPEPDEPSELEDELDEAEDEEEVFEDEGDSDEVDEEDEDDYEADEVSDGEESEEDEVDEVEKEDESASTDDDEEEEFDDEEYEESEEDGEWDEEDSDEEDEEEVEEEELVEKPPARSRR